MKINSQYRRIFDKPLTPYQRVLNAEQISQNTKNRLLEQQQGLDPFALKNEYREKVEGYLQACQSNI